MINLPQVRSDAIRTIRQRAATADVTNVTAARMDEAGPPDLGHILGEFGGEFAGARLVLACDVLEFIPEGATYFDIHLITTGSSVALGRVT